MSRLRRKYYDYFSIIYDRFVALHSSDRSGNLREYLSEKTQTAKQDRILDICTGTGSLLQHLSKRVGKNGIVVGVDFSRGMLVVAGRKTNRLNQVYLIQANVGHLPFKKHLFDTATCAYGFYELKGETQDKCLREIGRVLKKRKPFLLMEHDIPKNPIIRAFFYARMASMGPQQALQILRHEIDLLSRHFKFVEKIRTPTGRSKIIICKEQNSTSA